ncbi:Endonuclease/exonuclease/phosphatase [Diplogelasinospora grovesii]|uniref:Endonuclease/exonuclease/phosphatase n=1 Tax=Diplogelasinospora grovesii TaxID=303347 RepID=A0AAN6NH51_9PEZI|nr:Endonuclease/exonuclease/phosphatase [Diplogelasinospora grovesii]
MPLRITTWNVNGLRNPFGYQPWCENRTFQAMFDKLEADIVVLQEIKMQRSDLTDDMIDVPGWDCFFCLASDKKGYSGVAIYTRTAKCCPIRAETGITGIHPSRGATQQQYRFLPADQAIGGYPNLENLSISPSKLDCEGRAVLLEFPAFVLIGVYCPAQRGGEPMRVEFRQTFLDALDQRVRGLIRQGKEVFVCGDLNVARDERDMAGLDEQLRKNSQTLDDFMSAPARRTFNHLIFGGRDDDRDADQEAPVLWDLCRDFHPAREAMYTCWDTKKNCRPGNFGSRIDYVLCSNGIRDWFVDASIQEGLLGSDHCPVFATLADTLVRKGKTLHLADIMNPPNMFRDGVRQREWATRDILPASLRFNFQRPRSVLQMFKSKRSNARGAHSMSDGPKLNREDERPTCQANEQSYPTREPECPINKDVERRPEAEQDGSSSETDTALPASSTSAPTSMANRPPPSSQVLKLPNSRSPLTSEDMTDDKAVEPSVTIDRSQREHAERTSASTPVNPASLSDGAPFTRTSTKGETPCMGQGRATSDTAPTSASTLPQQPSMPEVAQKPPAKRQAEAAALSPQHKKTKASLTKKASVSSSGFAQKSLKSFFKPRTPAPVSSPSAVTPSPETMSAATNTATSGLDVSISTAVGTRVAAEGNRPSEDHAIASMGDSDPPGPGDLKDKVFDPIASKESWQKLLAKPAIPRCEHGEDCKKLVTKKPGVNCGEF